MKEEQFISKCVTQPWGLGKLRARTILGGMVNRLRQQKPVRLGLSERPGEDFCGDPLPKMQIVGALAIIPLYGVISMDVPDWIKQYGFNLTDADDIEEEIAEALEDANVEQLWFDVSSPGGLSIAGNKLFDLIEAANKKKPCFAFCGDGRDMASAAYDAVAACTAIFSGYYADGIGCIGSYLAYLDDTEFWANLGITFEVFRSGEIKGIGESTPLTAEQKNFLQGIVDLAGARIRKNVLKHRTLIDPADLQGQWFDGIEAARRGFVAANVDDLQAAIAKARRLV